MAGLVPGIHVCLAAAFVKRWMPGTSPGMTSFTIHRLHFDAPRDEILP
jgi:hypothetical protein